MPRTKTRRQATLTEDQIQVLVSKICHSQEQAEEEARATALLIFTDELERESGSSNTSMIAKQAVFSLCSDESMEAHIQLIRSEF